MLKFKKVVKCFCAVVGIPLFAISSFLLFSIFTAEPKLKEDILNLFNMIEYYDPNKPSEEIENNINKYEGINEDKYKGYNISSFDNSSYTSLKTEYTHSPEYGLLGYKDGSLEVSYKRGMLDFYTEQVLASNNEIYESLYYPGDMLVDTRLFSDVVIEYEYDLKNNLKGLFLNEEYLTKENNENRLDYLLDDKAYRSVKYDENHKIIADEFLGFTNSYTYDGEYLKANNISKVKKSNNTITIIKDGKSISYSFDYEYNNKRLPSSIKTEEYELDIHYINDKISAIYKNGFLYVGYILDDDLNYVGFSYNDKIYYYIFDLDGNVIKILDEVSYLHNSFGEVYTDVKNDIFLRSFIMYEDYFYDPFNNLLFGDKEIIIPSEFRRISLNNDFERLSSAFANSLIKNTAIKKDEIMAIEIFYSVIKHNVVANFEALGIEAASDVELVNKQNELVNTVDVFTLDYNSSNMSFNNLLNGYQGFQIAYNDYTDLADVDKATDIIESFSKSRAMYYTNSYDESLNIVKGKLEFAGQFIIFDYLISYECTGDGLIMFNFKENSSANYNYALNLFNYDTDEYVNYVSDTFNMEAFLKNSTSIIPGINQESYDAITEYITDVTKITGTVSQGDLRYFDEGYYEAMANVEAGDTLNLDIFKNLSEDDMITVTSDGDLIVKALPFYNNPTFIRESLKTACAFAVAAIVVVVCPSTGVIVIPIIKGASLNIGCNILASLTSSAITLATQEGLGPDFFNKLPEIMNGAMIDASKSFLKDAAVGGAMGLGSAIWGQIKRGHEIHKLSKSLNLKPNNKAIADRLSDYKFSYMWDDPVAAAEYDDIRVLERLINSGGSVTRKINYKSGSRIVRKYVCSTGKKVLSDEEV